MLMHPAAWKKGPIRPAAVYPPIKSKTTQRVLALFARRPGACLSLGDLRAEIDVSESLLRNAVTTLIGRRYLEHAGRNGSWRLYRAVKA